ESALPEEVREHGAAFRALARAYKRITAPVGELGLATLAISTTALAGDDPTYAALEAALASITEERDEHASEMQAAHESAEFRGGELRRHEAVRLIERAEDLLEQVRDLAR